MEFDTVEKLEKFLAGAEDVQAYEAQKYYPLSRTQQDIFVEYDAAPNDTTYNLPILLPLDSLIDITRLQRAIIAAIDAHPYLKTKLFFNDSGEIRARRQDDLPAEVSIKTVEKLPAPAELVRPFKLTEEPLYRAEIFSTPEKNYLFLDFHHIVYDGSSEDIFFDDINAAYDGQALTKETYTGFEVALDEMKARASEKLTAAKKYFDLIFANADVEILPRVDFKENVGKKDSVVAFESYQSSLDVEAVKNFCATNSCTLNTFFLAMFGYFLGKETRRTSSTFTTIYHGRNDSRLSNSIGMFVKTLPVLTDVAENSSVKNFVDSLGRQLVNSMAHDIYSFAEISAAYGFKGELMCVYQGEDFSDYHVAGTSSRTLPLMPSAAMSDLCLEIFLENGAFIFRFEYRPTVYKADTVKNFARACEEVAEKFLASDVLEKFAIDDYIRSEKKVAVTIDTTAPKNKTQQKIFDCVAEIIGTKNFGIKTDFYSVGLTSIGAIRLNVLLSRAFGKIIRTRDIKEHENVEKLEKFLAGAQAGQSYELQLDYPLTQTQNGIFVECVAKPGSTIYNIPNLYRLGKNVDVEKLQRAVKAAIDAHPYLKTTLLMNDDGDICACRHDDLSAEVNILHVDKLPPTEELVRPFELLDKPLYRAEIFIADEKYLFLDCHHIVSDGESFDILLDDINAAYDGKILDKETYTGFEVALDEMKARNSDALSKAKTYYDSIFRGCDADCKLAKDFYLSGKKTPASIGGEMNFRLTDKNSSAKLLLSKEKMPMKITQVQMGELIELSPLAEEELKKSKYYNPDLAPTKVKDRTWTTRDVADLWIGLSVSIPALAVATSLVTLGLSPLLSIINVILGNLIVLIPIQLNSHVGTKYGIPYPIYARLTFGTFGAHISCVSRSIVGCGWAAVLFWVGGGAIAALIGIAIPFFSDPNEVIALPGNDHVVIGQLIGFFIFVLICGLVAYNGMEKIKVVQNLGGPFLIVVLLGLCAWSVITITASGHSVLDVFAAGNNMELINRNGGFAFVFLAGLTGNIAFWGTIALNIPDFSRMAKSQKDQFKGQMLGMPIPMAICAIVGALFAQATLYKYGEVSFDPTTVFYYMDNKIALMICSFGVIIATLTTCVAVNIVAPSNGWSSLAPQKISYKSGVTITLLISVFVTQPWFIYGSGSTFIFSWLNNYGMIIAPVAAILCADFFVCKKKRVDIYSLYKGNDGRYRYSKGWNWCAVIAWAVSFILPFLGNTVFAFRSSDRSTPNLLDMIAANSYLFSFAIAFILYVILMRSNVFGRQEEKGYVSEQEHEEITRRAE